MVTLKEAALSFKPSKELTDLDKIPVDIEFKTDTFTGKDGKQIPYTYIEIDGWKYSIKSKIMSQIQMVISARPMTKYIKVAKAPNGEVYVMPLD